MSLFGWSMPPGAWGSTLPGEEPEREQPRCETCGAFLPYEPTRVEHTTWMETDWGKNGVGEETPTPDLRGHNPAL